MMSGLAALFGRGRRQGMRFYVNGVEISKIEPKLEFLAEDDWMTPFFKYVFHDRKDWGNEIYLQTMEDPRKNPDTPMSSVWFGPVPAEVRSKGFWTTAVYNGPTTSDAAAR